MTLPDQLYNLRRYTKDDALVLLKQIILSHTDQELQDAWHELFSRGVMQIVDFSGETMRPSPLLTFLHPWLICPVFRAQGIEVPEHAKQYDVKDNQ